MFLMSFLMGVVLSLVSSSRLDTDITFRHLPWLKIKLAMFLKMRKRQKECDQERERNINGANHGQIDIDVETKV